VLATHADCPSDATPEQLRALPLGALPHVGVYNVDGRMEPRTRRSRSTRTHGDVPLLIGWTDFDGSSPRRGTRRTGRGRIRGATRRVRVRRLAGADLGYQMYTDAHGAPRGDRTKRRRRRAISISFRTCAWRIAYPRARTAMRSRSCSIIGTRPCRRWPERRGSRRDGHGVFVLGELRENRRAAVRVRPHGSVTIGERTEPDGAQRVRGGCATSASANSMRKKQRGARERTRHSASRTLRASGGSSCPRIEQRRIDDGRQRAGR
jgi:hypothetical protein